MEKYILEVLRNRSTKRNEDCIYEQLRKSKKSDFWVGDLSIDTDDYWAVSLPEKINLALAIYANDCKSSMFGYSNQEHLFYASPDELMQFEDFKNLFNSINNALAESNRDGKDVPLRKVVLGKAQFRRYCFGKHDSNGNAVWVPKQNGNHEEPAIRKMLRNSNLVYVGPEVDTEYFNIMVASVKEMTTLIFNTQIEFIVHNEQTWRYE